MPMPGSVSADDGPMAHLLKVRNRLILDPAPFGTDPNVTPDAWGEGLAYDGTVTLAGARPEDRFALAIGFQWLDQWTGANACVLVPSTGALGEAASGSSQQVLGKSSRPTAFELYWGIDVHIWGREAPDSIVGMDRDIYRFSEAWRIFANVARVLMYSVNARGKWLAHQGWNNDTGVLRYGEAMLLTFAAPFSVYDYERRSIPMPQKPVFGTGQPVVVSPPEV